MTDPRETLARIRAQADAATEGPWYSQCGEDTPTERMDAGVCNANGEWVTSDVSDSDAEFIAASRTTVPALLDLADAVLKRHVEGRTFHGPGFSQRMCECGANWPCPDYTAATTALEGPHHA